ncbi:hypothetical protein BM221_007523 [Beauveria bassiana]|uniref:Uncharacterized protein n=1 Tax=Beauveria bassiana TaxID=176275 RepID=A0A2N6NGZ8_BEABA|nr:hypothetical protein BM221_007523 [Beauveria bassiana]
MAASRLQHNKMPSTFCTAVLITPSQSHTRSLAPPGRFMGFSAAVTLNSIINRQPSIVGLVQERSSFPAELGLLEPRPLVYWSSVEDRIGRP